jgi:cardiolipin synthase
VAGISDALDGFLAKTFGWQTRLGGFLDPLADKLLLVASFVAVGWGGLVPLWLVGLVILRDVIIVAGALTYHFRVGRFEAEPTFISKVNTAVQIALVLLVVVDKGLMAVAPWLIPALVGIVTLTTLVSGANYVIEWSRRASHSDR